MRQSESETPSVPKWAKQGVNPPERSWSWVEVSVWNERMLAALVNGVKGGKWFSLIDKVHRPTTLAAAWERVKANRGAAGVDGQSVAAFAAHAERYLEELARDGVLRLQRTSYAHGDLRGAWLAIAATDDGSVNAAVFEEAEERHVLLNSVDDIEH
jgi:RNA-directed DNA polymerase